MNLVFKHSRAAVVFLLLAFMTACTQSGTAVSSYNGNLGRTASISKDAQQAKILASRERARKKAAARKEAFTKKRRAGKKETTAKRSRKKQTASAKSRKTKRAKKAVKKTKKRLAKRKIAKTNRSKKRKTVKIKRSSSAFVGGRSKGIIKSAPWNCVPSRLKRVIAQVSKKFGRVIINSTHRSSGYNRRVGGKKRSYHLKCQAVDFRVQGRTKGLTRWLARHPSVGGFKRYRAGFYHIDTGPKRTW